ncbi:TonB family protein [Hymenobacter sp. UYCo722]|uniref:TonB family protein n=1 Tax=Hymenobacter sp. UYCo722 TaxID=3156335 RepID=UPI003394AFDC
MPQLPGGGGSSAIVSAIQSRVTYPLEALKRRITGRVFVSFTVSASGIVGDAQVVKGIGGGCDESVLNAVQQLPQFIPGRQAGQPVPVRFTVPVTFQITAPTAELAADTTQQIYTLVQQMPELPGGGGLAAITRAVQRAVVQPAAALASRQVDKVFVSFIVGPSGVVRDIKVVKGVNTDYNTAALSAVQHLPRFVGGKLLGRPVSVSFTVPVEFGRSVRIR